MLVHLYCSFIENQLVAGTIMVTGFFIFLSGFRFDLLYHRLKNCQVYPWMNDGMIILTSFQGIGMHLKVRLVESALARIPWLSDILAVILLLWNFIGFPPAIDAILLHELAHIMKKITF